MHRLGRAAAIGFPVWLLLLVLLPLTGAGPLACLAAATVIAAGTALWSDRWHARRVGATAARVSGSRPQMSPVTAVGLTLGAVVILAYVIFVIVIASGGGN